MDAAINEVLASEGYKRYRLRTAYSHVYRSPDSEEAAPYLRPSGTFSSAYDLKEGELSGSEKENQRIHYEARSERMKEGEALKILTIRRYSAAITIPQNAERCNENRYSPLLLILLFVFFIHLSSICISLFLVLMLF